jgi:hypothetical protein
MRNVPRGWGGTRWAQALYGMGGDAEQGHSHDMGDRKRFTGGAEGTTRGMHASEERACQCQRRA